MNRFFTLFLFKPVWPRLPNTLQNRFSLVVLTLAGALLLSLLHLPSDDGRTSDDLVTVNSGATTWWSSPQTTEPSDPPRKTSTHLSIAGQANKVALEKVDRQALDRRLLADPAQQARIAHYFADRFQVSLTAMRQYVQHSVETASETRLDPLLILAVMSVESSFRPDVQSPMGAKGLMQVMPRVHADKLAPYGGVDAASIPEVNIRVGALILKQTIALAGSLAGGLRYYLGASTGNSDGGYVAKVLARYAKLVSMSGGNADDIVIPPRIASTNIVGEPIADTVANPPAGNDELDLVLALEQHTNQLDHP